MDYLKNLELVNRYEINKCVNKYESESSFLYRFIFPCRQEYIPDYYTSSTKRTVVILIAYYSISCCVIVVKARKKL